METPGFNRQDFNVQKIMSCSQENMDWKKSSPLKTYSKKSTPASGENGDGKSRYGRSHKPKLSGDFLSTDKKVSQYLKIDIDNQMHYFKSSPYAVQKSPVKPVVPGQPRGRGRPPKALSTTPARVPDRKYQDLNDAMGHVLAMSDLEAPPPTSTETLDVKNILIFPPDDQQSDSEEVINENDWNVGDLAWACVGGYPYWPCAVTKEPEQHIFRKTKIHGKSKQQREFIHVRFFGDKGRRSWIVASNVIPFHGLDSFQSLAEETCTTPSIKKKDPKTFKAFTILPSVRKTWQAAVSEAESLREAPRNERVQYFFNMFPPTPPTLIERSEEKPAPKKRGRKSKAELAAMAAVALSTPSPESKKIKLEPMSPPLLGTPNKSPGRGRPRMSVFEVKKEPVTPIRMCRTPSPTPTYFTAKIKEEPITPNQSILPLAELMPGSSQSTPLTDSLKKKRGRPLGSKKKKAPSDDADFEPVKRKYVKKTPLERKENQNKKKSDAADKKKRVIENKRFRDPAFEMFYDKNFDNVSAENPSLSNEDIEKFIDKMWKEVKDQQPAGFRSRDNAENVSNDSGNDNDSDSRSRSNSPTPIILPLSKTPFRRGISLFSGIRGDKVCQVCLKNGEFAEVLKCKGPCGLFFHVGCSDEDRYGMRYREEENVSSVKKKRGRRPRSVETSLLETSSVVTEGQHRQPQPIQYLPVTNSLIPLATPETPLKRKRGRPRKTPNLTPSEFSASITIKQEPDPHCLPDQPLTSLDNCVDYSLIGEGFIGFDDIPFDIEDKISKLISLCKSINEECEINKNEPSSASLEVTSSSNDSGVKSGDSPTDFITQQSIFDNTNIELSKIPNGLPTELEALRKEMFLQDSEPSNNDKNDLINIESINSLSFRKTNDEVSLDTIRSDNKLLATLRGDSFESETSNNNLVVDDSSTDDRLMIEESPPHAENSETKSAIMSIISKESSLIYDNMNSQSVETDPNLQNKETDNNNLRKISLDMPDLDFSESEDTMPSTVNNEEPRTEMRVASPPPKSEDAMPPIVINEEPRTEMQVVSPPPESEDAMPPIVTNEEPRTEMQVVSPPPESEDAMPPIITNEEPRTEMQVASPPPESEDAMPPTVTNEEPRTEMQVASPPPETDETTNKLPEGPNGDVQEPENYFQSVDYPTEVKQEEDTNSEISISIFSGTVSSEPLVPAEPPIDVDSASIDDASLFTAVKKEEKEVKMYSNNHRKSIDQLVSSQPGASLTSDPVLNCHPSTSSSTVISRQNSSSTNQEEDNGSRFSDAESDKAKKWMCGLCTNSLSGPCFACGKDDAVDKIKCGYCNKAFHDLCKKRWPHCVNTISAKGKELFYCPQHVCHTCVSDNPGSVYARFTNDRLVRCVRCPVSYHYGNYCIPAGSLILSNSQILCPKHYIPPKKSVNHVSASWCALCAAGGDLVCCDLCPNSFHLSCVNLEVTPQGSYFCEDCDTGRFPLYGELIWVKLGTYRWWPARILFPQEIPDNINLLPHVTGEFAVEFFGSHDYYWVNRGRCFLYHEGDGSSQNISKSRTDEIYLKGVDESKIAFKKWNEERANREAFTRTTMKPPKYQKISANKIVGNAARYMVTDNDQVGPKCECDPNKPDPCGPDSHCINRLLSVECDPQICRANENCCNRNFEKRVYPRLVPFKTETRGWGLKCLDAIPKGSFIIEYVGEMIDEDEYRKRLEGMQQNKDENFYFLTIDKDRMLDAGPKGNVSRFMNHSCEPNCETQKWTVGGDTRVGVFTLENIQANTELVFNYNLTTNGNTKVECKCGAANCSGYIGAKNNNKQANKQVKTQTSVDDKKGGIKKKRRKSKAASSKHTEDSCFTCGHGGELLLCDDASCPKAYHLSCLGLTKHPAGGWVCPWHQCSVCSATKVQRCTLCINSYCAEHAEGNISLNRTHGLLCFSHNPSDSGSDWSDDRGLASDEEETVSKKQPTKKYSKTKMVNGHVD